MDNIMKSKDGRLLGKFDPGLAFEMRDAKEQCISSQERERAKIAQCEAWAWWERKKADERYNDILDEMGCGF